MSELTKIKKSKSRTAAALSFILIGIVTLLSHLHLGFDIGFKYVGAVFIVIGIIISALNIFKSLKTINRLKSKQNGN